MPGGALPPLDFPFGGSGLGRSGAQHARRMIWLDLVPTVAGGVNRIFF